MNIVCTQEDEKKRKGRKTGKTRLNFSGAGFLTLKLVLIERDEADKLSYKNIMIKNLFIVL